MVIIFRLKQKAGTPLADFCPCVARKNAGYAPDADKPKVKILGVGLAVCRLLIN
jgi:hypothetical protein